MSSVFCSLKSCSFLLHFSPVPSFFHLLAAADTSNSFGGGGRWGQRHNRQCMNPPAQQILLGTVLASNPAHISVNHCAIRDQSSK